MHLLIFVLCFHICFGIYSFYFGLICNNYSMFLAIDMVRQLAQHDSNRPLKTHSALPQGRTHATRGPFICSPSMRAAFFMGPCALKPTAMFTRLLGMAGQLSGIC